ncbi:MAG: ABC transporter ATP-binding protein [Chloroflexi bacterium]|nr:ABC transporter ATP-binding protein [Chloroflexota bacterium]
MRSERSVTTAVQSPTSVREEIIEVRDLTKVYPTQKGEPVTALSNINFEVQEGEFITCVGPSGCGKTTLLKILAGLQPKTTGEVRLRGTPVVGARRDIGIVFQNSVLLPWRTVLQNTLLPIEVHGLDKSRFVPRAKELIQMAGLAGFEEKYPFELSGGMQQRNSIIRALIHDPALLLMDEPFGALDAMTRELMNVELQRIWQESQKTVFFITHSISEAVFLADRVIVLSARPGRIAEIVTVELPRPRDLDMMSGPEFGQYVTRIRHRFDLRGGID